MFFVLIDINISIQLKQMRRSVREKHFHSIENNRALATFRAGDSAEMSEPMACPLPLYLPGFADIPGTDDG